MTESSSPQLRAGGIPKASLSEKPPAQLNVKPVQLVQPQVGMVGQNGVAPGSATSQPPAIGQPLAMPKIEPVKPLNANGALSRGGSAQSAQSAHSAQEPPLDTAKTFSAPENDASLQQLKELRKVCVLPEVPVGAALAAFKSACENKGAATKELDLTGFQDVYRKVCEDHGKAPPSAGVMQEVFQLFDKDGNGKMDMMELCSGLSMMCQGSEDDKIQAVFSCFDTDGNGLISQDEMYIFLNSVFKVVLTPAVMESLADCGVEISGPEDLANVTTTECFAQADVDKDGELSIEEFKSWFYAPRNDPAFMFAPMRTLLE